jgi:uncharacterized membrane protein (Fun14 family)
MVSADGRLAIILAAIGLFTAVLGYLARAMVADLRSDTNANTTAIQNLNAELVQFRIQLADRQVADARAEIAEIRAASLRRRRRWR